MDKVQKHNSFNTPYLFQIHGNKIWKEHILYSTPVILLSQFMVSSSIFRPKIFLWNIILQNQSKN